MIAFEEQIRGWMALIARTRDVRHQVAPYRQLTLLGAFFSQWQIAEFDHSAAALFAQKRQEGVRIGTMDLKMAAIALAHDALLLTANTVHFAKVAELRHENWLEATAT